MRIARAEDVDEGLDLGALQSPRRMVSVEQVVYLSDFGADTAVDVPHFAVTFGGERMLAAMGFGPTTLRPTYFTGWPPR
ncbi:hypothetical protein [Pseudomonas sp. 102515]|uniref:hypothetical protein n=1 Tax=Pseudomonas sp. 102515 TaxID=3071568 RepID=UPI0035BC5A98